MSDRKHTPDILAEILTGEAPAAEMEFAAPPSPPRRPAAVRKPAVKKAPEPGAAPDHSRTLKTPKERPANPTGWEYKIASFQEHNGWRVRYIDGQEVKDWTDGFNLSEYNVYAGEQGWELAGACSGTPLYGHRDTYQLFYKRPRS